MCCVLVSCVHPVAVLNTAKGDYVDEKYSIVGRTTGIYVAVGVSFCLIYDVGFSAMFTTMSCMWVLYVNLRSSLIPNILGVCS